MLVVSQSNKTVVNTRHAAKFLIKRGGKLKDKEEADEYYIAVCNSPDEISSGSILAFYSTEKEAQAALHDFLCDYESGQRIYRFLTPEELSERHPNC